jgi:thiol-disulfide isomerase/thioredoxin|tara:strand:+ start:1619 stop:2002 length:384 start_codon:yes stop_codon:yes gene_type:complete
MMKKFITLIAFLIAAFSFAQGQSLLGTDDFEKEISRGIIVVEFWASWNDANSPEWITKLKECEVYRVDIGTHMDLQTEFEITSIPTIIIFNNGNVEETFNANIMFQLEAEKKDVQSKVDEIILNNFN